MRKYQPAWNTLKNNPSMPLRIAAHPALHQRIFKAVVKEKDEDAVFKLLMSENHQFSKLSRTSENGILTIKLKIYLGMDDII